MHCNGASCLRNPNLKGENSMELKELRKKPHLSHSSINMYMECGLQYKFSKIDKLKPQFIADNLVYGITVHRVLADFHQERLIGKLLSADDLCDLFGMYWKSAAEDSESIKYSKKNTYDSIMSGGKSAAKAYHRHLPKDLYTIVAIEEPFSITPDGLDIPIIGVMDLVEEDSDGTIIITENKTSGKAYSNLQIDKNLQLTVYQIAARSNGYADREILLRIDCLIKTTTQHLNHITPIAVGLMNTGLFGRFGKPMTVSKRVFSSPTIIVGNALTANSKTHTAINGLRRIWRR
jgi:putative RecB family exonuclease